MKVSPLSTIFFFVPSIHGFQFKNLESSANNFCAPLNISDIYFTFSVYIVYIQREHVKNNLFITSVDL